MSNKKLEKILRLAQGSNFESERDAALTAFKRLSNKEKVNLDNQHWENSQNSTSYAESNHFDVFFTFGTDLRVPNRCFSLHDEYLQADKARRAQSIKDAVSKGLDSLDNMRPYTDRYELIKVTKLKRNIKKRNPLDHAKILLRETQMCTKEINDLTGIPESKLKLMRQNII